VSKGHRTRSYRRSFPAPGRLVDVGTHRLHLQCAGDGRPAVVLDAALGASSLSWSLVQPRVAAVTHTCSYDRAGFGWSDRGPLPRTAARLATELCALLERAALPLPVVLVGHSFGAFVVRLLASRHSEMVAGLLLIEPAHPEEWMQPTVEQRQQIARGVRLCRHGATAARLGLARAAAAFVRAGAVGAAWGLVKMVSRGGLQRTDQGILAPVWKLPPETRRLVEHAWTRPQFFEALGSQIGSICDSAAEVLVETPPDFGDLPIVVMTGAGATDARKRADAALARMSTRGRHVIVPESGHWIPLDAPDAVASAIVDMVRAIRS
jgi:pimeloyl-ACP methyl ester carboxylesterase